MPYVLDKWQWISGINWTRPASYLEFVVSIQKDLKGQSEFCSPKDEPTPPFHIRLGWTTLLELSLVTLRPSTMPGSGPTAFRAYVGVDTWTPSFTIGDLDLGTLLPNVPNFSPATKSYTTELSRDWPQAESLTGDPVPDPFVEDKLMPTSSGLGTTEQFRFGTSVVLEYWAVSLVGDEYCVNHFGDLFWARQIGSLTPLSAREVSVSDISFDYAGKVYRPFAIGLGRLAPNTNFPRYTGRFRVLCRPEDDEPDDED